jgi:hypothetical protein
MYRNAVRSLIAVAVLSTPSLAQLSEAPAMKHPAVALAVARYDAALAFRTSEQLRRMQLPVVRTYSGLVVRADTTALSSDLLTQIDSAVARARSEAAALFGVTTDSLMRGATLVLEPRMVEVTGDSATRDSDKRVRADAVAMRGSGQMDATWPFDGPGATALQDYFVKWYSVAATQHLPPQIQQWMGARPAVRPWTTEERRVAHFVLVFQSPTIGMACTNGSIPACRVALAVVADGDTIGAWFDQPTRRDRALAGLRAFGGARSGPGAVPPDTIRRCTELGDDVACRVILTRVRVPSPTGRVSREQIVRGALIRGGVRAFERLRADTTMSIESAVASAAGVPFDSLVTTWRRELLAARTPSPAPNATDWLLGIVMIGGAVGVAVGRKPR